MEEQGIEINDKIIERLKMKIIFLENKNIQSKEFSESQMINKIKHMIEEEIQCYSNQ